MKRFMRLPRPPRMLGKKMAFTNIVTALAALLVAGVCLISFQFLNLRTALVEDLRVQARIVGANSSAALLFGDSKASEETLGGLAASPMVVSATVFNAQSQALAHYRRAAEPALQAPSHALIESGYRYTWDHVDVVEAIRVNDQKIGLVMIHASLDLLFSQLLTYAGLTLLVTLGSLGLAYLLVSSMRHAVQRAEAHLHFLAHVDPVTTLPNRHEFNERLAFALKRAKRYESSVGLLLFDLDNFKIVNDTLGHDAGDELLRIVAQRLAASLRSTDVICRIGGDEFVVIVEPNDDNREASFVARKILGTLSAPFEVKGNQLYVTASIGVSLYPRDATDALTLMRNADTAMYQAKNKGKNGFEIFELEMDLRAQKRLKLEANLRRALANNELELHYQPQIDLRSNCITGIEVLARWTCPELGSVSPAEFIPVAEESGIIVALGRWVLQTAVRQAAAWRDEGLFASIEHVAVNLSARQTKDPSLMGDIAAILEETGFDPKLLELEITEGVLMDNVHANVALLQRLQDAGIHLSIDDFGTGYSSMSYLKRFPIDQLKIDRSFIHAVPGDGAAIATAIIAMAHSLGLSVVAEGVESKEQVDFLRASGCDIMQGYYFARPMPATELAKLLQQECAKALLNRA